MKPTIDELLTRYYAGETTLDEENQLRAFFRDATHVPDHLRTHAPLFQYASAARQEQPSADFVAKLEQQLTRQPVWTVQRITTWSLRLAAGLTLLLIGFMGGRFYAELGYGDSDRLAVSNSDRPQAEAVKKVLAFDAQAQTSASDRIQAVNQSTDLDRADRETTQLLINTLNFDDNVNVRLAACEALLHFEREEGVREALIQSLRIQKDPNVQLTLIDALVAMKDKRATTELQWLARNQQALDIVRLKAEEGLGSLSGPGESPS